MKFQHHIQTFLYALNFKQNSETNNKKKKRNPVKKFGNTTQQQKQLKKIHKSEKLTNSQPNFCPKTSKQMCNATID